MKHVNRFVAGAVVLIAVLAAAVACAGDDDADHGAAGKGMDGGSMMSGSAPAGLVRVDLVNWAVEPALSSVKAGRVTFWAVHDMTHMHTDDEGGVTHDLQVMEKRGDGSFEMAGQVQGLTMGQAKELTLELGPGEYELSCNVVEQIDGKMVSHYQKGMHTTFKVTG